MNDIQFSDPVPVISSQECAWYQTFDFPDGQLVRGRWDYRHNVDDYIGRYDFKGKKVLEVGPASGFLTVSMEQRGASSVTCIDTDIEDSVWETVPRLDRNVDQFVKQRLAGTPSLRRAWWLTQKVFNCNAKVLYCGASKIPESLGHFDVAFLGSVLQHFQNPYVILSKVASLSDIIISSEMYLPRLEGGSIAEFAPKATNNVLDSWWYLSSHIVQDMMKTLNFERVEFYLSKFRRYNLKNPDIKLDTYVDFDFYTAIYKKATKLPDNYENISYI